MINHIRPNLSFLKYFSFVFRGRVTLPDAWFDAYHTIPIGWTHLLLNYIGPSNGEGIKIYFNGEEIVAKNTHTGSSTFPDGDGQVVVGRLLTNRDQVYASVQVDGLFYFNMSLNILQIKAIYDSYWNIKTKIVLADTLTKLSFIHDIYSNCF